MPKKLKRRKIRTRIKSQKEIKRVDIKFTCRKCGDKFSNKIDLDVHDNQIHRRKPALREIKLLEQGFVPEETKIGTKFKGKNKIIIT